MPLNVLNVVQLGSEGVLDVNDENLPVCLTLIEESHDAENLDLLDLANIADLLANLADIERIVVAPRLRLGVSRRGVLPRLMQAKRQSFGTQIACDQIGAGATPLGGVEKRTYLGESTVVPDISVVGEAVADVAQAALLDVLLDGVERLLL